MNKQVVVLAAGSRGAAVVELQTKLKGWGCFSGVIDGDFGPLTDKAVRDFQSKRQGEVKYARGPLAIDGVVGAETWAELLRISVEYLDVVKAPTRVTKTQADFIFQNRTEVSQICELNECLDRFQINKPQRIRHFLAQVGHESGGLVFAKEIWGPTPAQRGYQGRKDLGNLQPGDGYRFRGAGYIQLTGRFNYQKFSEFMGDRRIIDLGCDYVSQAYPFTSAGFWWHNNGMNTLCDDPFVNVERVTRRVNGGTNGLLDRVAYYNRACKAIPA